MSNYCKVNRISAEAVRALRNRDPNMAAPITITSHSLDRPLTGITLQAAPLRPGADKALGVPSRMGERLHYRGGTATDLAGNVIKQPRRCC